MMFGFGEFQIYRIKAQDKDIYFILSLGSMLNRRHINRAKLEDEELDYFHNDSYFVNFFSTDLFFNNFKKIKTLHSIAFNN